MSIENWHRWTWPERLIYLAINVVGPLAVIGMIAWVVWRSS